MTVARPFFSGGNECGGEITAADILGKRRRHLLRQVGGNRYHRLEARHRLRCHLEGQPVHRPDHAHQHLHGEQKVRA